MSANTMPDSPLQVPAPGAPPRDMPPPPPGTGLTTGPIPTIPPAAAAPAPTAPPVDGTGADTKAEAKAQARADKEARARDKAEAKAAANEAKAASPAPTRSTSAGTSLGRRLVIGAVWGPIAVGAAALLEMWDSASGGDLAVRPLRLMTTLVEGGPGLVDGPIWLGVAINVGIGIVIGTLFALLAGRFRGARGVLVGALVVGAAVYAADWYLVTPQLPLLALRDEVLLLASRLVLGAVLAVGFIGIADRRG